jgi:hypothetical protein
LVDFTRLTPPTSAREPRMRAAELAVRYCCVGEAFSVPMLAGTMRAATHPLTRAVLERIVQDEAPHAQLGWLFLEWADGWLDDEQRSALAGVALDALMSYLPAYRDLRSKRDGEYTSEGYRLSDVHALGWMDSEAYAALARESVLHDVVAPLGRRGIAVDERGIAALMG